MAQSIYTNQDIYKPQLWAMASLQVLFENLGIRGKVHTDFRQEIAERGDTINTRFPEIFAAEDAGASGEVSTINAPQATNVAVVLDKNQNVTFEVRDRDSAVALKSLKDEFMEPAALGLLRSIEENGLVKMTDPTTGFRDATDAAGVIEIGGAASSTVDEPASFHILAIAQAAKLLNDSKCPQDNRYMVISAQQQLDMQIDTTNANLLLLKQNESGTGQTLREGTIGRLFGFDVDMQQQLSDANVQVADSGSNGVYPFGAAADPAPFWHRNGVAYVNRNMEDPPPGAGVASVSRDFMGQALRVQIGYQLVEKRTLVSMDALWGWKVMRQNMGGTILSLAS